MTEREAMAVLVSARHIGYMHRAHALAAAGSAEDLLAAPDAYEPVLGARAIAAIRRALRQEDDLLGYLEDTQTHLILPQEYPQRLAHTVRAPHLLFCQGCADLNDAVHISIVGTRGADGYGLRHTRRIAKELAESGVCVVSGLALGIDTAAHKGALDGNGRTIAVLGGALDRLYPADNRYLMMCIKESGGSVVSEYPPGVPPARHSFVQRNRIVAGMSLGVLVTQAPMKSGALSTVQYALDEGREVFALPGDIDRPGSQLPNRLIEEGARPVTCAGDILRLMVAEKKRPAAPAEQPARQAGRAPARALDSGEQAVYDALAAGEKDFDALSAATGMQDDELGSALMMLELDGIIVSLPGLGFRLA